jgi:hypothetical protein
MILKDESALAMPGKGADLRVALKEAVAYYDRHWPKSQPTQMLSEWVGEAGRLHAIVTYASLAECERELPELMADSAFMDLVQKWSACVVPGSFRRTFLRPV